MTAHTQLWVYNSENRFVGSFYHNTCRVKRIKRFFENNQFWDRLIYIVGKLWIMAVLLTLSIHLAEIPTNPQNFANTSGIILWYNLRL